MKSLRQSLFDIYNNLAYLDPNRKVPATKEVQENTFNEIRSILQELHASVNTAEEIIALLGNKKEVSK